MAKLFALVDRTGAQGSFASLHEAMRAAVPELDPSVWEEDGDGRVWTLGEFTITEIENADPP
jgi:hypothetical protein